MSPLAAIFIGFFVSSVSVFAALHRVSGVAGVETLSAAVRMSLGGSAVLLLVVAEARSIRQNRMFSFGFSRQAVRHVYVTRGAGIGALLWGLDTGLIVTTYRVSIASWAAVVLTALHLVPSWVGVIYAVAFSVPLIALIALPRWRGQESVDRLEPRWIPRLLERRMTTVRVLTASLAAVVALGLSAVGLERILGLV
ncbi:MAG: hypothetical protein M3R63_06735 [Actinomycetota bacterium]|nr:hypothetical protein [Actinomycetota bacterium]